MALLWTFHPVRIIADVVRSLDFRRPDGREYPVNEIKRIIGELDVHGALVRLPERDGYYRLRNELRVSLYRELLESQNPLLLRRALFSALGYQPQGRRHFYWPVRDQGSTIAILHAALFTGVPETELDALRQDISASMDWNAILMEAGLAAFDGPVSSALRRGGVGACRLGGEPRQSGLEPRTFRSPTGSSSRPPGRDRDSVG
jgi:hypothetical protein